ncbi:unnamed protein product, partial [Iphiclides podalirius]
MQYIIDQIFAGNRIGDLTPSPSEMERQEQARIEEDARLQEEKEAELKRRLAMGEEIESIHSEEISPEERENRRLEDEYKRHVRNIQRMERSRFVIREKNKKFNKDTALYLELAGLKKPEASEEMKQRAAAFIQNIYRQFMNIKRKQLREKRLREKLEMIIPAQPMPSTKTELRNVQEIRRRFRQNYYEKWLKENIKEKTRILQLKEGYIMDDITTEIREWFRVWYNKVRTFDEFPWPEEGGSILVVTGETFTIEEYIEWRTAEEKRLKEESGNPKSKEQIKAEKLQAKMEKRRLEKEAMEKEKKRLLDYKKSRLNPDNDPGVYIKGSYRERGGHSTPQSVSRPERPITAASPKLGRCRVLLEQWLETRCAHTRRRMPLSPRPAAISARDRSEAERFRRVYRHLHNGSFISSQR